MDAWLDGWFDGWIDDAAVDEAMDGLVDEGWTDAYNWMDGSIDRLFG